MPSQWKQKLHMTKSATILGYNRHFLNRQQTGSHTHTPRK